MPSRLSFREMMLRDAITIIRRHFAAFATTIMPIRLLSAILPPRDVIDVCRRHDVTPDAAR